MTQAILSISSLIIGLLIGLTLAHSKESTSPATQQPFKVTTIDQPTMPEPEEKLYVNAKPVQSNKVDQTHSKESIENGLLLTKIEEQANIIELLNSKYTELHAQLNETSREINALTFRVETHSESFRPMRQRQENSVFPSGISPLLPPKQ